MLKKSLLFFVSCVLGLMYSIVAQNVTVDAKLDSSRIVIGDQLMLHLTVTADTGRVISVQDAKKWQFANCEVVEAKSMTSKQAKSQVRYSQDFLLTSFDTGYAKIEPVCIYLNDTQLVAQTQPITFYVDSLPVFVDTSAAFKDIVLPKDGKDVEIIYPERDGKQIAKTIFLIFIVLAIIALAFFLVKKYLIPYLQAKKLEELKAMLKENAGTVAMNSLKGLKSKKLWQKGQVKDYYSELSMILRTYIDHQWDVNAKEMVTSEIMEAMERLEIEDDLAKELHRFFALSDLVKYAKEQPLVEEHEASLKNAYNFVKVTDQQEHAKLAAQQSDKSKKRK